MNITNGVVVFSEIYNQLFEEESKNTSKSEIYPPKACTSSASCSNTSDSVVVENNPTILSSQDEEILSILEELQGKSPDKVSNNNNDRVSGSF